MLRRVLFGLLLVLLLATAAGASTPGGAILFSAARPGKGAVVMVRPDGTGLDNLTSNETGYETDVRSYSWSPDGSRIVFETHRDGPSSTEIYVMNAAGSEQQRLTFDSGHDSIFDVEPVWSPDGRVIAFAQSRNLRDSIWLMNPDGTDRRELANVGSIVRHLTWSPDSTRLLYDVNNAPPNRVEIVDVRTGIRRSLTPPNTNDFDPSWSPDGRYVALASNAPPTGNSIQIVTAADGARRALSIVPGINPAWSPDGTELAFAGIRTFPEYTTRYGAPQRVDVYVVRADGTGLRRLTGPLDEKALLGAPGGSEPTWWPDGSRLFYRSADGSVSTTYVVNADGSCEQRFGFTADPLLYPLWRPLPATLPPPAQCVDLRLRADGPEDIAGLGAPAPLRLSVENDGNVAVSAASLGITIPPRAAIQLDPRLACSREVALVCALPPLPAQTSATFYLALSSAQPGLLKAQFAVAGRSLEVDEPVLPCRTVGTKAADDLRGTNGSDSICGRGGADRIDALAGNDIVDAGPGDDTVVGGPGRDTITTGDGRDVALVRDGRRDIVTCGTGRDLVVADRFDRVAADCERVLRR